jgi:hypothetical protein
MADFHRQHNRKNDNEYTDFSNADKRWNLVTDHPLQNGSEDNGTY